MTATRRAHTRVSVGTRVSAASVAFTLVTIGTVSVVGGVFAAAFAMTVVKSTTRQPFRIATTLGQTVNSGLQYSTIVGWASPSPSTVVCGNGKIEGSEACDDGNTKACDGCSSVCTRETLADTVDCGLNFASVCGNGKLEGSETCDDGNIQSCDGCSAACQRETLADAVNCGQNFGFTCGNGVLETGEACDDGNTKSCDRCSSTCQIEQGLGDLADCGGSFTTVAFRRGDANGDGRVDLADATAVFDFATCLERSPGCAGDPNALACRVNYALCYTAPSCEDARDANDDGFLSRADGYSLIGWILYGRQQPPAPGPYTVGPDPTQDLLGCQMYRS